MPKIFTYRLEEILSENNEALYNEVSKKIPVVLLPDGGGGWYEEIINEVANIGYSEAKRPDACFAHELLHVKYELNGLKLPKFIDKDGVADMLGELFNNLCHFKFFDEFKSLKFDDIDFLNERDAEQTENTIESTLSKFEQMRIKLGRSLPGTRALMIPYVILKSPHDNSEVSKKQIGRLKAVGEQEFFRKIDVIIDDWTNSKTMDASETLARIFKICGNLWIGFCQSGLHQDLIVSGNMPD